MLTSGSLIGERFRVERALDAESAFTGRDERDGKGVLLVPLRPALAQRAAALSRIDHLHLARVIEVAEDAGQQVLVSERVEGATLADRMRKKEHLEPVGAVRAALRLADALSTIHAAGAVHGAVSAAGIVLEPSDREATPVLCFVPSHDDSSFKSPARRAGGPPSAADDTWACAAALFALLNAEEPPADGIGSEAELERKGIVEASLRNALRRALHREGMERATNLVLFRQELARYLVDHDAEEQAPPSSNLEPPPLPASARSERPPPETAVARTSAPRAEAAGRRRRVPLVAMGGIMIGLIAAWGVSALRGGKPQVVEVAVVASATPSAPPAIELGDVPVTGEEQLATGDKMASCVAGYLPKGAFTGAPNVSWLCKETHPARGADQLRVAVIRGAKPGEVTQAMKIFGRLGWYDMAAFATTRYGCCPDPAPLELPEPNPTCGSMSEALETLARAVVAAEDYEGALKGYRQTIHCEVNAGRGTRFRHAGHPQGGEEGAFHELIASLRE